MNFDLLVVSPQISESAENFISNTTDGRIVGGIIYGLLLLATIILILYAVKFFFKLHRSEKPEIRNRYKKQMIGTIFGIVGVGSVYGILVLVMAITKQSDPSCSAVIQDIITCGNAFSL